MAIPIDYERWILLGAAAALYVLMCVRVARHVGRTGRNATAWFFITMLCTAVPAFMVLRAHYRASLPRDEPEDDSPSPAPGGDVGRRCEHCGALLAGQTPPPDPPPTTCPHCGMKIDEVHLA